MTSSEKEWGAYNAAVKAGTIKTPARGRSPKRSGSTTSRSGSGRTQPTKNEIF
jgi:hypothetical protein